MTPSRIRNLVVGLASPQGLARFVKIVGINLMVGLGLIGILVSGPIAVVKSYDVIQSLGSSTLRDHRQDLPNYEGIEWGSQYYLDHLGIRSSYTDYVGWRLDPLSSATINIGERGRRQSVVPTGASQDEVWLFGGSTVFGMGVNDQNTIPSALADQLGMIVVNHGQDNYVARQSLNRLLREYEKEPLHSSETRTVVFYDGVNDVHVKCRAENVDLVTDRQSQIRSSLEKAQKRSNISISQVLWPSLTLLDKIRERGVLGESQRDFDELYVCDEDKERAELVAEALVSDWLAAQAITESHGDRFMAVLQPVAYLSDTRLGHLPVMDFADEFAKQYEVVYPLIRSAALEADLNFRDLSGIYDRDEYIYIDFCHVSPNGNKYMAEALAEDLA